MAVPTERYWLSWAGYGSRVKPRPNPVQWVWYAAGGGLPKRLSPWVLHDTTSRTWVLRHLARTLMQLAPFVVVLLVLIPGPFWIRGVGVGGGVVMGLIFSFAYMPETIEHRLKKAGYPVGTGAGVQRQAAAAREEATEARRKATRERLAERADRRRRR